MGNHCAKYVHPPSKSGKGVNADSRKVSRVIAFMLRILQAIKCMFLKPPYLAKMLNL